MIERLERMIYFPSRMNEKMSIPCSIENRLIDRESEAADLRGGARLRGGAAPECPHRSLKSGLFPIF